MTTEGAATFKAGDRELEFALQPATEGNSGYDISALLKETGNTTLDVGFVNTASCQSKITYIDGDAGILRYRGYPIEQLAERSTFLETSYLVLYGELPTAEQLAEFIGPALQWRCVGRDGRWHELPRVAVAPGALTANVLEAPPLDDAQFATLVQDSEADELLAALERDLPDVWQRTRGMLRTSPEIEVLYRP